MDTDLVVVGAGIVGLACARALQRREPALRVVVVDKDDRVAAQQSGHNSGVLHSGLYYRPGSLKAALCRDGRRRLLDYCAERGLPHRLSGKLVVATSEEEVGRLDELERRGHANGLEGLQRLDATGLRTQEPEVVGREGLWVPDAGVVDFVEVCRALAADLRDAGALLRLGARVQSVREVAFGLEVRLGDGSLVRTRAALNCAGLHSDRVAALFGAESELRVIPFRGEYWRLRPPADAMVRGLIYPVPDPALPFLGVHLTRDVHEEVRAGPNAVFALAREGYRHRDVDPGHVAATLSYVGFWRMARRHWRSGAAEIRRSGSRRLLLRDLRRLVPALGADHLERAGSGVRAQVVGRDGALVDDFHFSSSPGALHVLNAPSPAATAALAIAEFVADRAQAELGL